MQKFSSVGGSRYNQIPATVNVTRKCNGQTLRYVGSLMALIPFPYPVLKVTKIIEKTYAT